MSRSDDLSVGDLFSETFSVLFANIVPFCLITGLCLLPQIILQFMIQTGAIFTIEPAQLATWSLALALMTVLLTQLATGAVSYGVFRHANGKQVSTSECMQVGINRLFPVLGVAFVFGLLLIIGIMACIIPGLIILTRYYVAVPAAVVEKPGIGGALSRSFELTLGYRGTIFGLVCLLFLFNVGLGILLGIIGSPGMVNAVIQSVVNIFVTALSAVAAALVYFHLRRIKEGLGAEELASIFD